MRFGLVGRSQHFLFAKKGKKKKKKQVSGKPSGRGSRSQGLNEVLRAIK